jgi:hypothetical protein
VAWDISEISLIFIVRDKRLFTGRSKKSGPGRKDVPQELKPGVFSIIYGPPKVVP